MHSQHLPSSSAPDPLATLPRNPRAATSAMDVESAASFLSTWTTDVWPTIMPTYDALLVQRPRKQDDATGIYYSEKIYKTLQHKKEVRNVTCNLTWLNPMANTLLQKDITVDAVARFALDLYTDTNSKTVAAAEEQLDEGDAAAEALPTAPTVVQDSQAEVLLTASKKKWKIPDRVPRGMEIPVPVTNADTEQQKGTWQRLGFDVVVNATWLAMKWALDEGDKAAVAALTNLILDWPFDFILFEGTDEEKDQNQFKYIVNLPAKIERMRDFCGLDATNLMRITAEVRAILQRQAAGKSMPTPKVVWEWMVQGDNIQWGLHHVPSLRTVTAMLHNWDTFKTNRLAMVIMDKAKQRFGRDNLFDWPTKISIIISKTDQETLGFVCESLYLHMLRKNAADPLSTQELSAKGGAIQGLLWQRRYVLKMLEEFPEMLRTDHGPSATLSKAQGVRKLLFSPIALYEKLEGKNKDPTWLRSLWNEPLRQFVKHVWDLTTGFYAAELKGALSSVAANKWNWEKFLDNERTKRRFTTDFKIAYDSIAKPKIVKEEENNEEQGAGTASAEEQGAGTASVAGQGAGKASPAKTPAQMSIFRRDCEAHVHSELQARVVMLTQDGNHDELRAKVASTRLYQNLADTGARLVAFYDVKNAKLIDRFVGEALTQREPCVDEEKFGMFLETANQMMKDSQDFCWIMCGRTESNLGKIVTLIQKLRWKCKTFHLVYDSRMLSKWYWQRMRGLANSKSLEKVLLCWKGRLPDGLPKDRLYVDKESPLYNEVMMRVPVCAPKDLAFVSKDVREKSLRTMGGVCDDSSRDLLGEVADTAANEPGEAATASHMASDFTQHVKRRRLYRQTTGTDVVWFPHDNAAELMKEFLWEAGGDKVRWVLHGTPASGAGVVGCLDMGASVVCMCEDEHHQTHFATCLQEKCVEAMLAGSRVFKDADLQARAERLLPGAPGARQRNVAKDTVKTALKDKAKLKRIAKKAAKKKVAAKKKAAAKKKDAAAKKEDESAEEEEDTDDDEQEEEEEEEEDDE